MTRFDEHGTWVLVREASQPREATSHRRAQRTSRHLRQSDPYSLADETWRDPPRRSSTSARSRSPDRRPGPAEQHRLDAYSSEEEPTQDAEALTTGRAAYVPRRVYEAPTHTERIALHSRRIGTTRIAQFPPLWAERICHSSLKHWGIHRVPESILHSGSKGPTPFAVSRGAPSFCSPTAWQSGPSIAFLCKPLKPSLCAVQHLCSYRHSISRLFISSLATSFNKAPECGIANKSIYKYNRYRIHQVHSSLITCWMSWKSAPH